MDTSRTRLIVAFAAGAWLAATAAQGWAAPRSPELTANLARIAAAAEGTASHSTRLPSQTPAAPAVADGTAAADTVAAQSAPVTPAAEHDPEKVAVGTEIMANLQFVEIAVAGARIAITEDKDFQQLPQANRQRLAALIEEEIRARKDIINREMAGANVDRFTVDQLRVILSLSRIKFIQAVVLHGAGLVPEPDPATMTPAEQALIEANGDQPYVLDFFKNIDMDPLGEQVGIAIHNAFTRYMAAPAAS
jgi:hypothetical protein